MHVVLYTATPAVGGAETVARNIVSRLVATCQVTVVGPNAAAIAAIAAGSPSVRSVVTARLTGKGDLRGARALRRVLRSLKPDVIHFNLTDMAACLPEIAVAATLPRVALVAVEHTGFPPQSRLQHWGKVVSVRLLDGHVAVTTALAAAVAAAARVRPEQVTVVPNGVASVTDVVRHRPSDTLRVGVVTRLTEGKGVDVVIDALCGLPGVHLDVAGDGPAMTTLVEQAARLGVADRVRFHGWVSDPTSIYENIDILVHATRDDVMPLSVIEAMQHGLPVVAAAVGGLPELVVDGCTGVLFAPDDVAAVRRAIAALGADPERRSAYGAAGRRRALERFDIDAMVAGYLAVYERAAVRRAGRRWRRSRRGPIR